MMEIIAMDMAPIMFASLVGSVAQIPRGIHLANPA